MIRALIVDDDRCVRKIIELVFEREGFIVESVPSGEEALKCLEKREYDLMLTDVEMPGMNGFELSRKVRKISCKCPTGECADACEESLVVENQNRPRFPMKIMGMSGDAFPRKKTARYFDYFLAKPFDVERLLAAVNILLNQLAL